MQRILGQPQAVRLLQDTLAAGRLHHAWVFAGPPGVGKCMTAIELARILLDPDAAPGLDGTVLSDPAGTTSRLIDAGSHPDLHVVRKELALFSENAQLRARKLINIPLDLLRERMIGGRTGDDKTHEGAVYRTSVHGHGKVFIIDEAELLDANAQNALLKTLEEPPVGTYLILITSRPHRLLPTIRSRCHFVHFGRLDDEAMKTWTERHAADLALEDADERRWIEQFVEGSPGTALHAARFGFYGWQRRLEPHLDELEQGRFPTGMGEAMAELVEAFAVAWVKENTNASKDAANKDGIRHLFGLLATHARRRLGHADGEAAARWLEAIDLINDAEQQIMSNVNLKLVLENLVAQWARIPVAVGS